MRKKKGVHKVQDNDVGAGHVRLSSAKHGAVLTEGLWNILKAKPRRGIYFYLQFGPKARFLAHSLVVRALMAPERFELNSFCECDSLLDYMLEFLYRGAVMVPRGKVRSLLNLSLQMHFQLLTDALESVEISDEAGLELLEIVCEDHPKTLAAGLWRSLSSSREVDFYFSWSGCQVAFHRLVADVFLDTERVIRHVRRRSSSIRVGKRVRQPSIASLLEFMYLGTVVVPREQLDDLLELSRQLKFQLLVEAVQQARGIIEPNSVLPSDPEEDDAGSDLSTSRMDDDVDDESLIPTSDDEADVDADLKSWQSDSSTEAKEPVICGCVIEELLSHPFSKRDPKEQDSIKKSGRPTPPLPALVKVEKFFVRRFRDETYKKIEWLTGCPQLNRLFCWPCLLFSSNFQVWDHIGYEDLSNFHNAVVRHNQSRNHAYSAAKLNGDTLPPAGWEGPDRPETPMEDAEPDECGECDGPKIGGAKSALTGCIIEQLLEEPFASLDAEVQLKVASGKRPTPSLPTLTKVGKGFVRRFQVSIYKKVDWLVGCKKMSKLFCWPCLLFSEDNGIWARKGYIDLQNLHTSIKRHGQSMKHLSCCAALKKLIRTGAGSSNREDVDMEAGEDDSTLEEELEEEEEGLDESSEIQIDSEISSTEEKDVDLIRTPVEAEMEDSRACPGQYTEILTSISNGCCLVDQLIKVPFINLDADVQLRVANAKHPTPSLPSLPRGSEKLIYRKADWLVGCHRLSRLFCWPCLLFATDNGIWSGKGFSNFQNLNWSISRHGRTRKHIYCCDVLAKVVETGKVSSRIEKDTTKEPNRISSPGVLCKEEVLEEFSSIQFNPVVSSHSSLDNLEGVDDRADLSTLKQESNLNNK